MREFRVTTNGTAFRVESGDVAGNHEVTFLKWTPVDYFGRRCGLWGRWWKRRKVMLYETQAGAVARCHEFREAEQRESGPWLAVGETK